jgi:DNA-binding NarL/FixJ family response regulator
MPVSVLLVDDHNIVRQGFRALLDNESDIRVIGEARTGLEALRLIETFLPNVVVLDVNIPEINGLELTRQLRKSHPNTKVVILSVYETEAYVVAALQNGAKAYVLKGADSSDLVRAIRLVMQGERYLSPPLNELEIESYQLKARDSTLDPCDRLSQRERQILILVAEGWSNLEIAGKLKLSVRTVEFHRARIMHKLNLQNNAELVKFAITHKLISLEPEDHLT